MGNNLTLPMPALSDLGPAMQALTTLQRRFVVAWFVSGQREKAAHMAGYAGEPGDNLLSVSAHQVWHNPRVQAAIIEYAKSSLKGLVPAALIALKSVIEDGGHKDRVKAVGMILNRVGLHETTEQVVVHQQESREEQLMRITEKARALGLDPKIVLGGAASFMQKAEAIDVDVIDVTPTTDGLEDIL